MLVVFILAAIIISRLFYIQVINGKLYSAQALGQQLGFAEVQGARGQVFLEKSKETMGRSGSGDVKSLAINEERYTVAAVLAQIKDKTSFAIAVSTVLGESTEFVKEKLEQGGAYTVIKKNVAAGQAEDLQKLKLAGLSLEEIAARQYPQENLASQVVGFMGGEGEGQYGIEGFYEDLLKGKKGISEEKRGLDLLDASAAGQDSLDGSDLYLTIDYNIQFEAESLLAQAYKDIDIESGQIIVLKPDTGRILALANFPSFNPNAYNVEKDLGIFQNSAVQKIFEPGSVFKPFTMAIALNEGKVDPDMMFNDIGSVKIGPDTVYNFDRQKYGQQTLSGILEKSINTGAVYLSQQVDRQTFRDYLEKWGFNEKTGIEQQGEVVSQNDLLKRGSAFGFATASFGQGIEMTPIQLARSFTAFANGGYVVKPYLVEKIVQGQETTETKPQLSDQVISAKTASEVTDMLINVVEKGFGNIARIPGYYLAGKTGTAEVPIVGGRGYYSDRTIQSFIGYGPALKPQFLILVKLDNPKVPKSSLSAAPIFKKLAQYIINYWQLPPDYEK